MNSPPTTLSSQSLSTPGKRPQRAAVSEEPGKKPKKPNSEIRKQQNRIASRNYREKRKRKLQYLQQLINDDSDDHQDPEPSPEQRKVYPRSLSADVPVAGSSSSPYMMPSTRAFGASSAVTTQAILAATAESFDTDQLVAEQTYSSYPSNWNAPIYSPPAPANIPWNMPPAWTSTLTCPSQTTTTTTTTRPHMYRYNTYPAQSPYQPYPSSSSHHPRELLLHADLYGYGANHASQSHAQGHLNVSMPTLCKPYHQGNHRPDTH